MVGNQEDGHESLCNGGTFSRRPQMYNWLTFLIWCSVNKAGDSGRDQGAAGTLISFSGQYSAE